MTRLSIESIEAALEHRDRLSVSTVEFLEQCRIVELVRRKNTYPIVTTDITEELITKYTSRQRKPIERARLEISTEKLTLIDPKTKQPMSIAHAEVVQAITEALKLGKSYDDARTIAIEVVIASIMEKLTQLGIKLPQTCIVQAWLFNVKKTLDEHVNTYMIQVSRR